MRETSGVYFSASDQVYPWTLGFLRSFRKYNPDMALIWIPFNEDIEATASLSNEYDFSTYTDPSFFDLEALGQAYELGHSAYGKYWFRRYAAFWGPLEHFLYLDARQLVLANLTPMIKPIESNQLDFFYYDLAIDQVYQSGDLRKRLLMEKGGRGFNSGRWASKKGIFSMEEILKLGHESLKYRDELNPRNTDQAFINYCIDSKPGLRTGQMAEWLGNTVHQSWAGQRGRVYRKQGKFYLWDYGGLDHKKQVILLHWAGYHWHDWLPNSKILSSFSPPVLLTSLRRVINGIKRYIKSIYLIRKWMRDV